MPLTSTLPTRQRVLLAADTSDGEETFQLSDPNEVDGQEIVVMKTDASGNAANFASGGAVIASLIRRGEIVTLYANGGAWFGTQPSRDDVIPVIYDETGAPVAHFESAGPAPVNALVFTNAEAGGTPTIEAVGTDTNIDISFSPKGTGSVNIYLQHVLDFFGHSILEFSPGSPNAVNTLVVTNNDAGNHVVLGTDGTDDNISIDLQPKGTGIVTVGGSPVLVDPGSPPAHTDVTTVVDAVAKTAIIQIQNVLISIGLLT